MSLKGFALPITRYVAKHAVLNFVPFAGSGRIVTDFDYQSCFVCQALQFQFPQPIPGTIAAATVSGDYEPLSRRVAFWDGATGKLITELPLHEGFVKAVKVSADGRKIHAVYDDYRVRLWNLPRLDEDPERVILWTQVITGIEADEFGNARFLDADEWQRRKERLIKLGGPPVSE